MNSFKKFLTVAILFLFISITFSSSIKANINKLSADIDSFVQIRGICGLDDENKTTHMLCYIKSGGVDHHCPHEFWHGTFFGIQIKIGTGIGTIGVGSLYMHLIGKDDETRITIYNILKTTTYQKDVNVSVKGFFGVFQPTGHISGGLFYGFALISHITPLTS
jgi:hypothetical protein